MNVSPRLREYIEHLDLNTGGGVGRTNVWNEQYARVQNLNSDQVLERFAKGHFMSCQGVRRLADPERPAADLVATLESSAAAIITGTAPLTKTIREKEAGYIDQEYRLAYTYFKHIKIVQEFNQFCEKNGFYPDWVMARNFYYARNIVGLMAYGGIQRPAAFLEFGAGSGALAIMLHRMNIVRRYVIVDLPEMLAFAAYEVERHLPGVPISFGPGESDGFSFVNPTEVDEISDRVDVSTNFVSFAEMERKWLDIYFKTIYRVSRPGALHYNVNRTHQNLHQSDGSHFYNHSLLYPYQASDDIAIWDIDPLQDISRSWVMARPGNPGYSRAAFLHGAGRRRLLPVRAFEPYSLASLLEEKPADWTPWAPGPPA